MAWTASKGNDLNSVDIKVTKGNGLADLITESHAAAEFQTSLANGMDVNKAVRVKKQVAVLGARGDYVELVMTMKALSTGVADDGAPIADSVFVEAIDFTGVPTAVQHTVFGEFSPFVTPKSSMQESMLDGIDRQEVALVLNEVWAADAADCLTAKTQKLRGIADSRITAIFASPATAGDAVAADYVILKLKIKPNSDGVFVIPAGSILWLDPGAGKFGESGA